MISDQSSVISQAFAIVFVVVLVLDSFVRSEDGWDSRPYPGDQAARGLKTAQNFRLKAVL